MSRRGRDARIPACASTWPPLRASCQQAPWRAAVARPWRRRAMPGCGESEAGRTLPGLRRGRCRACHRTHVLASPDSYPRRVDHVDVVARALMGAAAGLGHRQAAALVERPASTVRDWIRRAPRNSKAVRVVAIRLLYALDPAVCPREPEYPIDAARSTDDAMRPDRPHPHDAHPPLMVQLNATRPRPLAAKSSTETNE